MKTSKELNDHLANVKHMRSVDAFVDSFNKGE